jgi:hypothetical protein
MTAYLPSLSVRDMEIGVRRPTRFVSRKRRISEEENSGFPWVSGKFLLVVAD